MKLCMTAGCFGKKISGPEIEKMDQELAKNSFLNLLKNLVIYFY